MREGTKKSLYVFLSCIMGVLLFLILHRVFVFVWLILQIADYGFFSTQMPYMQVLAIEYVSLIITLFLGAWYGIWIGEYWYEKVYVEKNHAGFFGHLVSKYFTRSHNVHSLAGKIEVLSKKLESEARELGSLSKNLPAVNTVKKAVRKKAALSRKFTKNGL